MKNQRENTNPGHSSDEKIIDALTPHCSFRASDGLKERVLAEARRETEKESRRTRPLFTRLRATAAFAAAAAILLALLIINPAEMYRANAAGRLLDAAAEIFGSTPSFGMTIEVRTLPQENFSYIDADAKFVRHELTVEPSTGRWRLAKPKRVAVSDGSDVRVYNPETALGTIFPAGSMGVIEDFSQILDPYMMLLQEEARVRGNRNYSCQKVVAGDVITLTVNAPAEGDFANDYLRNTSISESDTRRAYRFDRESGRLLEMQIDLWRNKKAITILRITDIAYGKPVDEAVFASPAGIEWLDRRTDSPADGESQFVGITPEQAVEKMFAAMRTWDEGVLKEVLSYYHLDALKRTYEGCRLIAHKQHFRSGTYGGVFVPCRILFADGRKEDIVVAVRNDNERGAWLADGGI